MLKCSVVIPTYNRAELLGHTLHALTRQTLPREEFEVIVVDDGSDDGTDAVARSFQDRLNLRYFFREREGYRAAKTRNVGIFKAEAEVCVLFDCGVLPGSGCLRAHLDSHAAGGDRPVAVTGYVFCYNFDGGDADLMRETIDVADPDATIAMLDANRQWVDMREDFYTKYGEDYDVLPAPWMNYWTCNVSARTDQLRAVGGFDEDFVAWGGEDIDLGYRLYRDGARFVLNREAVAIHCPHPKSEQVNNSEADANYRRMADKYRTPITRLLLSIPDVHFFNLNDIITLRGMPDCADYLAANDAVARTAWAPRAPRPANSR
ncbi:glycosyl transferase [Acrocarpospora phusangensis]|uniref:Glycosyl transferase n=1 Tax=Acrocarpospora phusangensis TaxID=1070424 RepID=A0A919Q8E0_9ACTN|nr:glycosyltransferase [Acrocarpospora phusangensis]GIH24374.1 glycosyl transferase [Acrocarpospora phusangensis]